MDERSVGDYDRTGFETIMSVMHIAHKHHDQKAVNELKKRFGEIIKEEVNHGKSTKSL